MFYDGKIWVGNAGDKKIYIYPSKANRHGLIAGATGTGKTTTLRTMAESFSDCGVPVFLADVKGDLSEMCVPGNAEGFIGKRIEEFGLYEEGFEFHGCPVTFWDVYGETGLPLRTTVSEMGPLLMAKVLGLNATQEAVLTVIYKIADDEGLLLIDTKDLKAMIQYCSENAKEYSMQYGNMSSQSLAAIIRAVVALESEGGEQFFAEPAIDIRDWLRVDENGAGMINILDCRTLMNSPNMYSTFMMWMLAELYENLPEVGDLEKPEMVFFFDEAHLLFNNASKSLLEKIEQIVKLIRSKGVGIYFITQSPKDVPDSVLAQLGNKVQHALRAYTPTEQKAVKAAAGSFRENPAIDTLDTLLNMGTGEALVSVLDEKGIPTEVERTIILPPQCGMSVLSDIERMSIINNDELYEVYAEYFDRDSAYEFLMRKSAEDAAAEEAAALEKQREREIAAYERQRQKEEEAWERQRQKDIDRMMRGFDAPPPPPPSRSTTKKRTTTTRTTSRSTTKRPPSTPRPTTVGGRVGREIGRDIGQALGGSLGRDIGGDIGKRIGRGIMGNMFYGR